MYLHVLVSAVVVGWLSGVALAASGEGLRTEFGGTYANNTPTVGQTLRSDGTGYVPQDMTGITECPLAWDATTNQFECRDVDDTQLTEVYCRQNGTNCPSGLDVDTTLFVTPTGSGTVCSISEPCGSVQQCIMTAYTEGPPSSTNRYACQVAPGVYTTSTPIRFSSDGTERGKPVNWLKIDGGDWKYTSLKSSNLNEPVMIIERVHNVKLDGINLAYSLVDNTVPVLEFRDGWKGIQLWHSAATASTDQPTPVVHVNGAGGTLWTKEFETFNLEVDESAPHWRIEATVRATSVPGQCDVATDNGACLVDADCNAVNDQCLRNTGDFYIDHGVIQSGSAGVHFLYGNYCEGGSTTLTGTADPDGTATLTGSGTNFDPEAKPGHLITVNNESRMVISVESDTSLTVSRAFSDTASGAAITQTDDGSNCEADSDCDSGTGTCQEGVCSGDSSVACTTANQATDCSGAGGTCNVGGSFSNIFVNQRYQMGGNEGGICPEDLNYCNADTDCNTCTTNSDCQTNFSDGECSAGNCTCEMFSFLVEGNASEVSLADVTFDCLYQSGSCSPAKYQIALLDGSDAEVCGLKTDSKSSNYLSSGSQILSNCYDYSYAEQFSPLSADPPVAIQEEGLCWWNDAENQLKCYDGTNDVEVVMVDEAGCLTGEPVVYDGSGNASCAAVSLTSGSAGITGTLAVGNGGTGGTSFTTNGVLYGQNLGALAVSNAGTDNQYLASNGGVPTFQALDAGDIGAGVVALDRGGFGSAVGGDSPGASNDCAFYWSNGAALAECYVTNDVIQVFENGNVTFRNTSNNGDVLRRSAGTLDWGLLAADSLNADFGDFTCTGAATGCTIDSRTGSDAGVVTGTAGTADTIAKWNADGDLVASTLLDSDACYVQTTTMCNPGDGGAHYADSSECTKAFGSILREWPAPNESVVMDDFTCTLVSDADNGEDITFTFGVATQASCAAGSDGGLTTCDYSTTQTCTLNGTTGANDTQCVNTTDVSVPAGGRWVIYSTYTSIGDDRWRCSVRFCNE